jgi:SAM-dependent methyltransferase
MATAHVQGSLWGARARDYADIVEGAFCPLYEAVFDATGVGAGTRLLDIGCGPGLAAQLAAQRGAQVAGLDAAEASLLIALERTPAGDFRAGDVEELPWPDASFDVVTSFNAVQFAADPVNALRQTRRVTKPGGRVAMAVWGRAEECETMVTVAAVTRLLQPRPGEDRPSAVPALERPAVLLEQAGLVPLTSGEVECTFAFPDLETAARGLMSAGTLVAAARQVGTDEVRRAVADSLTPFRTSAGGYRQHNRFRFVIASACSGMR